MIRSTSMVAAVVAAVAAISAPLRAADAPALDKVATSKIQDLSAVLKVQKADFKELGKISPDFKRSYYFKRMKIAYKYPNRTRLETRALGMNGVLVFNGDVRYYKLPIKSETKNIKGHPGQKQSLLQFGVFAMDYLKLDYEPQYLRTEPNGQVVYKLVQRNTTNHSHEIVYVNPKTHITDRRQSINGDGKLTMELRYTGVKELQPGIFVPTRIEVYNAEGKLGAAQSVEELQLNSGLKDALFATSS